MADVLRFKIVKVKDLLPEQLEWFKDAPRLVDSAGEEYVISPKIGEINEKGHLVIKPATLGQARLDEDFRLG